MSYYCTSVDNYIDSAENCTWYACADWVYDEEDATQWFMEEHEDSDGSFGISSSGVKYVMVWNDDDGKASIVAVTPNPRPSYNKSTIDEEDTDDEVEIKIKEVRKPEYAQIFE